MKMPSIVMRIKTIKRLAIAWWLVSVAVNFGIAFEQPDRVLEVERSASVYHSYEFSEIDDTPPPKGFKPFYVSHYGRHGSRRLTGTFVADTLASLEKAEAADGLTEAGKALLADVRRIADAHEDMSGQLTERGAQEHRTLARRMAARFPGVFVGARHVRCQSAIFHRVLISQANFTMALKDAAPAFTFDFITGDKYQKMLNGPHWARGTANVAEKIKAATDAYAKENIDPAPLVERIFRSASSPVDALKFARDIFAVASICQCLRCEIAGLDIYRYFTAEEIDALGRTLACEHYADMANSVEFGDVPLDGSRILNWIMPDKLMYNIEHFISRINPIVYIVIFYVLVNLISRPLGMLQYSLFYGLFDGVHSLFDALGLHLSDSVVSILTTY